MRSEPGKLPAALLTLAIHALLFGMLYFGVNWQARQPEGMEVELWAQLPEQEAAPPPAVPAPPPVEPAPKTEPAKQREAEQPEPVAKPDIALPDKKRKPELKKNEPKKPNTPPKKMTKAEKKKADDDLRASEEAESRTEEQARKDKEARERQAAKAREAAASEKEKYKGLIRSKIRSRIVMPPDVPDNAMAEFDVTLLPEGTVLDVRKVKSSGNAAYDSAVERAIWKAGPLPVPTDEEVRARFVNPNKLRLKFSPSDGG
jgi:colicin import membrane protein